MFYRRIFFHFILTLVFPVFFAFLGKAIFRHSSRMGGGIAFWNHANPNDTIRTTGRDQRKAGRLLGVSGRTVFSLRKQGKIAAIKLGVGMQCRDVYPIESLRAFLASAK